MTAHLPGHPMGLLSYSRPADRNTALFSPINGASGPGEAHNRSVGPVPSKLGAGRAQRLGGSGGMPPRKFLNFGHSEQFWCVLGGFSSMARHAYKPRYKLQSA